MLSRLSVCVCASIFLHFLATSSLRSHGHHAGRECVSLFSVHACVGKLRWMSCWKAGAAAQAPPSRPQPPLTSSENSCSLQLRVCLSGGPKESLESRPQSPKSSYICFGGWLHCPSRMNTPPPAPRKANLVASTAPAKPTAKVCSVTQSSTHSSHHPPAPPKQHMC